MKLRTIFLIQNLSDVELPFLSRTCEHCVMPKTNIASHAKIFVRRRNASRNSGFIHRAIVSLPILQSYATTSVIKFSGHFGKSVPFDLVPTLYFSCTLPSGNAMTGLMQMMFFPIAPECLFSKNSGLNRTSFELSCSIFANRGKV